jgi:MoaA/NifB/PqqE/SkfB family radical SAM enzyme
MSKQVLKAMLERQPPPGPETVHIDITNGCNTNCITCWDHSPLLATPQSPQWKRSRARVEDVVALLAELQVLGGTKNIVLSGMGEPFTHPDVYEMIEAVKERRLFLTIITNLVAADADRIVDSGVDQLLIGIHGASEQSYLAFHPNFRAVEWHKLLAMLDRFKARARRFKHVQVIADTNAHELVAMVEFAANYSASQVNFKLASLQAGTERCRIEERQRDKLLSKDIAAAQGRAKELGIETNLAVFEQQLSAGGEATASIAEVGCFMGYAYSRVLVDRTVLYCCNTDVVVGQLAPSAGFGELWRGEAWSALRERFHRGDYLESCRQCGKFNQNVKLSNAFARKYGELKLLEATGRVGGQPRFSAGQRRLPVLVGGE